MFATRIQLFLACIHSSLPNRERTGSELFRSVLVSPGSLGGGGGGLKMNPLIFLALNFCCLTDCQKFWHNCSLFMNISFDAT